MHKHKYEKCSGALDFKEGRIPHLTPTQRINQSVQSQMPHSHHPPLQHVLLQLSQSCTTLPKKHSCGLTLTPSINGTMGQVLALWMCMMCSLIIAEMDCTTTLAPAAQSQNLRTQANWTTLWSAAHAVESRKNQIHSAITQSLSILGLKYLQVNQPTHQSVHKVCMKHLSSRQASRH